MAAYLAHTSVTYYITYNTQVFENYITANTPIIEVVRSIQIEEKFSLLDKADGSILDWAYQEAGIALAYIIELKPTRLIPATRIHGIQTQEVMPNVLETLSVEKCGWNRENDRRSGTKK